MGFKAAPLNTSFMVASIIGLIISAIYLRTISLTWAVAFGILFFIMFIASMISMSRASPDTQLMSRPK